MRGRGVVRAVPWAACLAAVLALGAQPAPTPLLDIASWKAVPADGVEMHLAAATGPDGGPALRIDYDFHGRGGWAAARRPLRVDLPAHYEIRFQLHGEAARNNQRGESETSPDVVERGSVLGPPRNNLELKLVDPSGSNVWWHVERAMVWPREWTPVRVKQRQITFAWGPLGGGEPHTLGALELTVSAAEGGRGTIWVSGLAIVPVDPPAANPGPLRAEATSEDPGHGAGAAVDGDARTAWRPAAGGAAELRVDLGGLRELGGLTLEWEAGRVPRRFAVELSSDGRLWGEGREVTRGGALRSQLRLPEAEARFVRLRLPAEAGCGQPCGLAELSVRPLAFGASPADFVSAIARESPRGAYPRGFSEAVYWTVAGVAGDRQEALVSEDGAVEVGERGFSFEPMVQLGDRLYTWADVSAEQSLADGDLPLPTVTWRIPPVPATAAGAPPAAAQAKLEVTALAAGEPGTSSLLVRYRLSNESEARLRGRLLLLARPFQVNPPYQFLNLAGGVAPIRRLACGSDSLAVDAVRAQVRPAPASCGALAFDEGELLARLRTGQPPLPREVDDPVGLATGALAWDVDLPPGGALQATLAAPLSEDAPLALGDGDGSAVLAAVERSVRAGWRQSLDRVAIDVPAAALPLVRTLRSNLAFVEIHRDGPALQPGSRSYARSWIRDGALTGVALLRLRHEGTVARFAEWFAGFQYPDGRVPCCVDQRGADPVPENDSHGELIHLIAETFRYTHDRALAERLFPHVEAAVDAIEALRQERRTPAYLAQDKRAFFGLLPESISHEGYSAKPVHSYWDDTFAYRGLDDAAALAAALGRGKLADRWERRRDEFRADLQVSLLAVRDAHDLEYLPGSVELADFDSTATTTMLDPGGLLSYLPRYTVEATFERFWRDFVARRDGAKAWEGYTPYEIRHVGSFVRLAATAGATGSGAAARAAAVDWKGRAHELLAWYLRDQRPPGWNGWPEAVHRAYREPRFLGDLPHGWVGSDFMRSLLDLFAYESEQRALVLGAGIPTAWLARPEGVSIRNLATPWGPLSYTLQARGGGWRFTVDGGLTVPPGGIVLVPPVRAPGQSARRDGRPQPLAADGTLVLRQVPAVVDFTAGTATSELHHGR